MIVILHSTKILLTDAFEQHKKTHRSFISNKVLFVKQVWIAERLFQFGAFSQSVDGKLRPGCNRFSPRHDLRCFFWLQQLRSYNEIPEIEN